VNCDEFEGAFPNLRFTAYEITSPQSTRYNCAAWAAGDVHRWWWPVPSPDAYWPGSRHDESIEAIIEVFRDRGYEACDSCSLENQYEKVAIYADDLGPTHVARQLPSGMWTSKCGRLQDITHTLEGLEGTTYGSVRVIMKRRAFPVPG
jgi:hypothetical protein